MPTERTQENPRLALKQAAEDLSRLPEPDEDAQAHSEQLIALIYDEIKSAGGRISFTCYMELALYAPGLGYYSAGSRKFGESGDFVTAPEISSLFSQALARQISEILKALAESGVEKRDVLEVGGGSGIMAADMLAELERLKSLPGSYFILELSADLRQRQKEMLSERVPHLLSRVQWLDELPTSGFSGVVVANELLDALPVVCFSVEKNGIKERYVTWQDNRFQWLSAAQESAKLKEQLEAVAKGLPVGYASEINLASNAWIQSIADSLEAGVVLLLDYGFPRHEYYLPERSAGTLMCHYRHRAHDDPFVYPGLQDITAHVDFTAIAEAAQASGLDVSGYTSQAYFLLSNGITELAEANTSNEQEQLLNAQQIRTLTMPNEMGELFKVMALTKKYESALTGFSMLDARHKL
jgi:SAM-dependent MidA family methyltransferase